MVGINPRAIYTIAKKEFMDSIRNKWIIFLTLIFIILIIVFSYVAGGPGGELLGDIESTAIFMVGVTSLLIPLIAIILGFATISGEAESGALYVVISYPVRRIEILLGKLIGLGSVLSVSILIGFGIGGSVIALTSGIDSIANYISFIFLSIFMGFIYLSLAILGSAISKTRTRSIGFGLLAFFWAMIYGTVIFAVLYATGNSFENIPDWFFNSVVFSPADMHQTAIMRVFGITEINMGMGAGPGLSFVIPEFLSLGLLLTAHIIWLIVPLSLAYYFFKKRDI